MQHHNKYSWEAELRLLRPLHRIEQGLPLPDPPYQMKFIKIITAIMIHGQELHKQPRGPAAACRQVLELEKKRSGTGSSGGNKGRRDEKCWEIKSSFGVN